MIRNALTLIGVVTVAALAVLTALAVAVRRDWAEEPDDMARPFLS